MKVAECAGEPAAEDCLAYHSMCCSDQAAVAPALPLAVALLNASRRDHTSIAPASSTVVCQHEQKEANERQDMNVDRYTLCASSH